MAKRLKGAKDASGMRGIRSRVASTGRLRRKRSDTMLATLEKIYSRKSVRKLLNH